MKNYFRNKTKRTITLLLLGFFIFSFLHSELGFLDYDGENHSTHDYCEIVKNISFHTKTLKEELPKLELNKGMCTHSFDNIKIILEQVPVERTAQKLLLKQKIEIYLHNNTFLL